MGFDVVAKLDEIINSLYPITLENKKIKTYCHGNHSYYSSMHPLADVVCKHCGRSEDGPGGDIVSEVKTVNADIANQAIFSLKELKRKIESGGFK